ncbi:XRE family transcriptional regulator [Deltaproteobacteria bacterium Smac51]|nr:XRE family transcriptional regulator [Deltaproteobacteria bacterium Smac51]
MNKPYQVILCELREDHDLTQKKVAEILGILPQTYARYESGERALPVRHLFTLADYFKVSSDYILGLAKRDEH